jgi:predicted nucleotidyltransferase
MTFAKRKMSFHEGIDSVRSLAKELSTRLGDVICLIVFGSFVRGRMDFKDIDLFVLTRTRHNIENPLITDSFMVEIHLMSLKELEGLKNEKILYGIWRDGFLLYGDPTPIFHKLKSFLKRRDWKVDNLRIERARLGLEDAKRKLEEYKRAKTNVERAYHLSTACEHAFHSAITAIEELLIKEKYPIPSDHGERFRLLDELSKKRSEIARLKLKERLGSLFTDPHVRGYYRSTLDLEEAEKCIRKVESYVKDIEKLLDN